MRAHVLALGLSFLTACSFSKDPYLFTSLADGSLVIVPDATADAGVIDEDAAPRDVGFEGPDASADAGAPEDATVFPDAAPLPITGKAAFFDAVAEGLEGVGSVDLPGIGHARTVEAWVKAPRTSRSARILGYGAQGQEFNLLLIVSTGNSHFIFWEAGDVTTSATLPEFDEETWHHLAVTVTASAAPDSRSVVSYYFDGTPAGSTTVASVRTSSATPTRQVIVGGTGAEDIGFTNLELDEVRLWSVARTADEIARDRSTLITRAPGLVGYWDMNVQGGGTGLAVPNRATASSTVAAPDLVTTGPVDFVDSTAF